MPVIGMIPIVIPAFWKTLNSDEGEEAGADEAAEDVAGHHGHVQDRQRDDAEDDEHTDRAHEPSWSVTAVKMKSVCCSGT